MPDQIKELKKEFMKIDKSQSGEITLDDLRRTMASHGSFAEEDINYIFNEINLDHTGKISYHEFLAATIRYFPNQFLWFQSNQFIKAHKQ
jgi:Ca2+-binding EF-hand superfamily protein